MDVLSVWKDVVAGLLIAGALGVLVPNSFWQSLFLIHSSTIINSIWGSMIGPLVAAMSFVCSVGNIPLAAVFWGGGISFSGVISFIFADLIVLPILNIYRKYYGLKMAAFLFLTSYISMVIAGLIIEYIFKFFHLIPTSSPDFISQVNISFNYTSILNIFFAIITVLLLVKFIKIKGFKMLKMMG